MGAKTTADFLTDVSARVARPTADGLQSSTELLSLADQELRTEIAEILISLRSAYWLTSSTVTVSAGTASYRIPDRALGSALATVTVYDTAGGYEFDLTQYSTEDRYLYNTTSSWPRGSAPFDYVLENGSVVLLPTPTASGYTMRMRYYARPPQLVATTAATAINKPASTTSLELAGTPPTTISAAGSLIDIVRGDGMHESMYTDLISGGYSAPNLALNASTPIVTADISASSTVPNSRTDYVCVRGQTVYPPLPEALYPCFVALTCAAYAEAIGDMRALEAARAIFERKKTSALALLSPRVDGQAPRPVPRTSVLRGGGIRGGWWGR